ncbi:porin [Herbaspirillum sp. LeCh32-8]|uniref:porin n=1 Tax=Herbaspirillum sp. LeCh32-8 TaxID=2821356 RepID=UPI001AE2CB04|nr:porin [Herbaspirillum sp. LeCh32-8]MBP0597708.1 porin [Herbaspirillum sp. LeCh32-8]
MKKIGMAIAALATSMPVFQAQAENISNTKVSIYGRLDAGVTTVSNEAGGRNYRLDDGVYGANRIGFKGEEDLGGGTQALFVLENSFSLGDGRALQGGALFGRQSYIGLRNDWGTLTLGNQYSSLTDFLVWYTGLCASGYAFHQGSYDNVSGDRLRHSLKYQSPSMNGFRYGATYGFGSGTAQRDKGWNVGAQYEQGSASIGVGYSRHERPVGAISNPYRSTGMSSFLGQSLVSADPATGQVVSRYSPANPFRVDRQDTWGLGGSYNFGKFTLAADTIDTRFDGYGRSSHVRVYEVSDIHQLTERTTLAASYQHTRAESTRWNQLSLQLSYALSKRTTLYLSGDYLRASSGTKAVIGGVFAPSSSNKQSDLRMAVLHTF